MIPEIELQVVDRGRCVVCSRVVLDTDVDPKDHATDSYALGVMHGLTVSAARVVLVCQSHAPIVSQLIEKTRAAFPAYEGLLADPRPRHVYTKKCDCTPWNPAHEPEPRCCVCGVGATVYLRHKDYGDACAHLVCADHANADDNHVPVDLAAYVEAFGAPVTLQ